MASIFNRVEAPSLPKFRYNLSHEFKLSTNFGRLTPIAVQEVIPGDTFKMNTEIFMRMAPLIHPILQRMQVDVHHFFVPYRIIWNDFEKFITGFDDEVYQRIPDHVPLIRFNNDSISTEDAIRKPNSLPHYMGIPLCRLDPRSQHMPPIEVNALPFRAYAQIWNDYYRDSIKQQKIDFQKSSFDVDYEDDEDNEAWILCQNRLRCYGKDYFTTAQPQPQLGDPAVLPAPVLNYVIPFDNGDILSGPGSVDTADNDLFVSTNDGIHDAGLTAHTGEFRYRTDVDYDGIDNNTELFTINKLKELFSLQKLFDVGNKFGSRYAEQTLGHFGVRSSDGRLQRAQYLGGGRIPVQINQISQVSEGSESSPLGYQAGQGIAQGADNYFSETFEEHGVIISILSIIPEPNYTFGIPRFLLKRDRFDFAFPELAQLGEQEVLGKEWNINQHITNVFGYQERYAEYKTAYNRCAGDFLTDLANFYVQGDQDQVQSVMDGSPFIVNPEDLQNIFAITDEDVDKFYIQAYHNIEKDCVLPYLNRNVNPTSWV